MRVLIAEDEEPAYELLRETLLDVDGSVDIAAHVRSTRELQQWLRDYPAPDLLLLDIRLSDGLSLAALRNSAVACPVVFTTAFDQYVLDAFECNGIDYLLKPIKPEKLARALNKYRRLRQHVASNMAGLADMLEGSPPRTRERILARKGVDFVSIRVQEVAYIHTEHKIVFLLDRLGNKYIVEKPLSVLERELSRAEFFRLNRQYLAHIDAIRRFKPAEHGRLRVDLDPPPRDEVIVSQERASVFLGWFDR